MTSPSKTSDCVAMKARIQRTLQAEFEARRDEFGSYAEFIVASVQEQEWCRQQWERIGGGSLAPAPP